MPLPKKSAKDDSIRFILYCIFHAGMRCNEVVQARSNWFNLDAGYISVHKTDTFTPKNHRNRTVPLSTPFKSFLEHYGFHSPFMLKPEIKQRKNSYRYDFRIPWKKGKKALVTATNARLKEDNKPATADLTWITPHLGRHTFASILSQQGVSIYKIAEWIGDTIEVCTKHYAHLAPSDNAIDALLGKNMVKLSRDIRLSSFGDSNKRLRAYSTFCRKYQRIFQRNDYHDSGNSVFGRDDVAGFCRRIHHGRIRGPEPFC